MSRWEVSDYVRKNVEPTVKEFIKKMESLSESQIECMKRDDFTLDLTGKGINPYQLQSLLEEYGYEEQDMDRNGWEMDFWIHMERVDGKHFDSGCERLLIEGCGIIFELKLEIDMRE